MEEDTKKQPDGSFKYYRFNRFYALIVVAAILAALILFVLLALCVSPQRSPLADYEWSASDKYDAELYPTLTVAPDGRFKIMQVSDLHILSGGALDRKSLDFVGRAIDAAQPDLLVVTGDLSLAADNAYAFSVWNDFVSEKGIKWAFVFGSNIQRSDYSFDELVNGNKEKASQLTLSDSTEGEGTFLRKYICNYRRLWENG